MKDVERLYDCTKRLYEHVKEGLPGEEREAYIENIENLLEERERLIEQLPPKYTGEEMNIGKKLLRYDRLIQGMLTQMFEKIRGDVGQINRQKVTNERYARPYRNGNVDGMFLDKRK